MLGLTLRKEFQGRRLKGTEIELTNEKKTGATQVPASEFLEITYPTADVLKALEALAPDHGRPVVLLGERGQGKSHLLAVLHHALSDAPATESWLQTWAERLSNPKIGQLKLRRGMRVIGESLHRQHYRYIWDLLFERHPEGQYIRGKWEGATTPATDIPSDRLILEMLEKHPTALLLDEFQVWYDGLTNTKQYPWRTWAFSFIQMLSEIAKEHPELLLLVVSVRNGNTDAYQQIHRVNPIQVDFKGPSAQQDRRRLLLHRLFENRHQVPPTDIEGLVATHASEFLRLRQEPPADHDKLRHDFLETWPFAPHLMRLLEDQVLVATSAQETRDLIRILVDIFKASGDRSPVLTAADFRLNDDASGIAALLDSMANSHHASLREKAQRNYQAVLETVRVPGTEVPHLAEVIGALWLRSLADGHRAGADRETLQLDVTRDRPIDDNGFQVELTAIEEASFNIHRVGNRLVFREEENPQARLTAEARNDRLFADGSDHAVLAKEVRYVLSGGDGTAKAFRVLVLPREWAADPWIATYETVCPENWDDRLPVVVLPESPEDLEPRLGIWLKDHVSRFRNTVRFLIPRVGCCNAYADRELILLARVILKASEWRGQSPEYGKLQQRYESDLRTRLKDRFDRFAILSVFDYLEPKNCKFHLEGLKARGSHVPEAIETCIRENLWVPEDFEALVLTAAASGDSVGKLLRELKEPRPNREECVPWLGETQMKEKLAGLCARGLIALDLRGMEVLQAKPGESETDALRRMQGRLGTGSHLDQTRILMPQPDPHTGGGSTDPTKKDPDAGRTGGQGGSHGKESPTDGTGKSEGPGGSGNPSGNGKEGTGDKGPHPGPDGAGQPKGEKTPGDLFTGGAARKVVELSTSAPTSPLNLLGRVESWAIGPGTRLSDVTVKLNAASGAQLQKLIRDLPEGLTYELSLKKEQDQ